MPNKIRVVHISRGFEDYVLDLLSTLGEAVELHQVLAEADEWMEEQIPDNVNVIRSKAKRVSSFANIISIARLYKLIRCIKPDLIHLQNGVIWEGLLPLLFPKIPVVVTVHDVTRHPIQKFQFVTPQFLLDFVAKSADSLIVHGEKLREKAREYYKPKAKIHVVPHGVITRYGGSSGKVSTGSNVLLFGTIDKWKGVEFLVQAEPLVREKLPDLQVKIAGGCRDITYYTSLTSKDQHVEMILRKQSPEEVNWLFEWADIIVLPYIEASQSGVLNLALNYCLPPVVTDVGALPDVVSNGRNGLIVEPENSSALAEAILRLLTDEELRANVVQNLSKDKAGIHSRNSIAAQTLKVYRNTVSTAYYVGK